MWTENFQMFKLDLKKAVEPEIKLPTSVGSLKKQENSRKKHLLLLYWLCQSLWLRGLQQMKILQGRGIPDHLSCLLRNLYAGQEATIRIGYGTTHWFQIRKEVYCHPACLTYMQSTSWEMLGWMKHKLEWGLLGEISITSNMQMTPPLWQKVRKN